MPLQKIARRYGAAANAFQERYIQKWPAHQLEAVRGMLLYARQHNVPVTFRWAESEGTFVEIGGTSRRITVLFRNPVPARAPTAAQRARATTQRPTNR
jgi:hypothetical protein